MDIYEATQALLTDAVPSANVTYYLLTYDEQTDQFTLPALPAVTYLYNNVTPIVDQGGVSSLNRVSLSVDVWGTLEDVSANGSAVLEAVSGQRIEVENVVFTVVAIEVRDIYEVGLQFHHKSISFGGIVEVGEERDDSK